MEDDDDDFTFPTVAAPEGKPGRGDDDPVVTTHHHPFQLLPLRPDLLAAPAPSPLWPFACSSSSSVLNKTADGQARAPVSGGTAGRAEERRRVEEGEEPRAASDEERMDLHWDCEGATATAAPPAASEPDKNRGGQEHAAERPKQQRRAEAEDDDDDKQRAAAVADAERMDKLWESFNNEDPDRWFLCDCSPSTDGAESEEGTCASSASPAARRGYGCAPAMLRASSRAGGAGQFCRDSRRGRRRRGAAAGWGALLLRLFRRLFAVDKTSTSRSPRGGEGGIYVP